MHIEVTEFLRCLGGHGPQYHCVLMLETLVERDVRTGVLACPVCHATYPIVDGVVDFGGATDADAGTATQAIGSPAADDVRALLGIGGPGGYLVQLGAAGRMASGLEQLLPGVHFILVNPPADVPASGSTSRVRSRHGIPLAASMARGVVVGRDHMGEPWLRESARLVLRGLRIVVLREPNTVPGVKRLAAGEGLWVGERVWSLSPTGAARRRPPRWVIGTQSAYSASIRSR